MEKAKVIRNIIFDMGGVLFDLNPRRCTHAFEALGAEEVACYVRDFRTEDLFLNIETGQMSTPEFCDEVRRMASISVADDKIIAAWNALLEPSSDVTRELLLSFKSLGYRLFLLSNTNEMHWTRASRELIPYPGRSVNDFFERSFLSYELGVRKPFPAIFEKVIAQTGINPEETLFVDDNENNVRTASQLGINTFHERDGHRWRDLLSGLLLQNREQSKAI